MEEVISTVIDLVIVFGILVLLCVLWSRFKHYMTKKRVLKAIKALDIDDELSNCVAGCNLRCTLAIEEYFVKHDWGMPFVGPWGNLDLCCMIGELRAEGKVKPLKPIVKGGK